jgi:hypothetical protein
MDTRHDWTVTVEDYCFGVYEFDTKHRWAKVRAEALGGHTLIYAGKCVTFTNCSALEVVSIAATAAICLFAAISFAIAKVSHGRTGAG